MHLSSCVLYPGLVYAFLYLVDTAARIYLPTKYSTFVRLTGLEINIFQLRWFTERFNRSLHRFGRSCPGFLSIWFMIGAMVASFLIPVALYILSVNLVSSTGSSEHGLGEEGELVIQAVIPGLNLPNSEIGYYFLSLLLCSVYHELGHALCAVNENVRVLGVGVFVLFLIPAAYVDLPTDQLITKSNLQKLRIFSAGVWHNIVLVAVSYMVLTGLPGLLLPFYTHGINPCVTYVSPDSPVTGPRGLKQGDVIKSIQGISVNNKAQFKNQIIECLHQNISKGYCIKHETYTQLKQINQIKDDHKVGVHVQGRSDDNCCDKKNESSSVCFQIYIQGGLVTSSCLPARSLVEGSESTGCSKAEDCHDDHLCALPVFTSNNTKFIQIVRSSDKHFLYVGNPVLIYTSTYLSDFCPRSSFVPVNFAEMISKLCTYVISFSAALALLNVVPSLLLDGQHMILVILDILFMGRYLILRRYIQVIVTICGTGLVITNIIIGFYTVIFTSDSSHFLFQ